MNDTVKFAGNLPCLPQGGSTAYLLNDKQPAGEGFNNYCRLTTPKLKFARLHAHRSGRCGVLQMIGNTNLLSSSHIITDLTYM